MNSDFSTSFRRKPESSAAPVPLPFLRKPESSAAPYHRHFGVSRNPVQPPYHYHSCASLPLYGVEQGQESIHKHTGFRLAPEWRRDSRRYFRISQCLPMLNK